MAHGDTDAIPCKGPGWSRLWRVLRLSCLPGLLAWLAACTIPPGPAKQANGDATEQASTAAPGAETPPATAGPSADGVRRPPANSPWSSAWSGTSSLFGNLGNLGSLGNLGNLVGSTGSGGTLTSDPGTAPAGALHVTVYYATDRQYHASSHNYGWQPNRQAPHLSYGSIVVSIPEKRAPGELPLPPWYDVLSSDDAQQYVLIKGNTRLSRAVFLATVKARIQAAPERRAAFIYIHGYSNSFDDAARRTAQMAVDLDIGALPVFYSWPSKGTLAGYAFDENAAEWTQTHLQAFLADFAEHSSATDIYIIAHSMGNRPMTVALASLLEQRADLRPLFKQVVLAAPDINADIFREQIAPRFASLKLPATLYASANDKAMRASYNFADWDRIGDIRGPVVGIPGMELIDASAVIMNFMGHDYFASNRVLLTDIATMIKTGQRAKHRGGLKGIPAQAPQYWVFP